VTSCLENLEMSGNYTDVREMSGISLKVMEMSGKKSCHGKLPKNFHNCINRVISSTHLVLYANYSNLLNMNFTV